MYFFEKDYEYFDSPWPHIIINDALDEDIAQRLSDDFIISQVEPTDVWKEFMTYQESRLDDMVALLDSA